MGTIAQDFARLRAYMNCVCHILWVQWDRDKDEVCGGSGGLRPPKSGRLVTAGQWTGIRTIPIIT